MADVRQISCILCLAAFDPPDLIVIALPHHKFLPDASVQLCQECCAAVLQTCVDRHNEAPPSDQIEGDQAADGEDQAHTEVVCDHTRGYLDVDNDWRCTKCGLPPDEGDI